MKHQKYIRNMITGVIVLTIMLTCAGCAHHTSDQAPNDDPDTTPAVSKAEQTEDYVDQQLLSTIRSLEEEGTIQGIYGDELTTRFQDLFRKHPEFFWLDGGFSYVEESSSEGITVQYKIGYQVPLSEVSAMDARFQDSTESLLSKLDSSMTDYEKALYVHDFLVETVEYDFAYYQQLEQNSTATSPDLSGTAYGCLVNHKGICDGYSKTFQYLMHKIGVECNYVSGESLVGFTGNHSWNYIVLDGEGYFVDVTWDDPLQSGQSLPIDRISHEYFCITSEELLKSHSINPEETVPVCSSYKYDYYRAHDQYMEEYNADEFATRLRNADRVLEIKFGSDAAADAAVNDCFTQNNFYKMDPSVKSCRYQTSNSGQILTIELTR